MITDEDELNKLLHALYWDVENGDLDEGRKRLVELQENVVRDFKTLFITKLDTAKHAIEELYSEAALKLLCEVGIFNEDGTINELFKTKLGL